MTVFLQKLKHICLSFHKACISGWLTNKANQSSHIRHRLYAVWKFHKWLLLKRFSNVEASRAWLQPPDAVKVTAGWPQPKDPRTAGPSGSLAQIGVWQPILSSFRLPRDNWPGDEKVFLNSIFFLKIFLLAYYYRVKWSREVKLLSCVWLFATPWTVAYKAPLSMNFPGKSTRVGCHFLLQGIFPAQGLNPGLPHCRQTLYCLSHQGSASRQHNLDASVLVECSVF